MTKQRSAIACILLACTGVLAAPPAKLLYQCTCQTPNKKGLCGIAIRHHHAKKTFSASLPRAQRLTDGWVVRPANCLNGQAYILTRGAQLFSGKKINALYSRIQTPLAKTGYVYHVRPNLPFTKSNYSLTVIQNARIIGIRKAKSEWQCGNGNHEASCSASFNTARCFVGHTCQFRIKNRQQ